MRTQWISNIRNGAGAATVAVLFAANVWAFDRVTVPAGAVIELQTTSSLDSATSQQGDTFSSTVRRSIYVDGNLAIPQSSSVDGRVTEVRPAGQGSQSGAIGVEFFRLVLADGTSYDLSGVLTTRAPNVNGQINSQDGRIAQSGNTNRRNVLIGGGDRTVIGTLNAILSGGQEVQLPSGSNVSMEFVSSVTIGTNEQQSQNSGVTNNAPVYTSSSIVRRAQTALRDRNFYSGSINGQLDSQTRKALADFQNQNGQPETGDLDQKTAARLGLVGSGQDAASSDRQLATSIYQKSQSLLNNYQSSLGIRINDIRAGLTSNNALIEGDLDLLLQANSFANAAAWYQQATATARSDGSSAVAARILLSSAQRVDGSLQNAQNKSRFAQQWPSIQADLNLVGANNPNDNNRGLNSDNNSVSNPDNNSAQVSGTGHFQWQGLVDGSDNITLRGSSVKMIHLTASNVQQATYQLSIALPFDEVQVNLNKVRGRGQIRLLEQPTASNNYTAVVQVNDQGTPGSAWYEFTLDW
ncbi:MAG TPA: peptidoglycan-binding domain-containing protein [Terriglobia bacterium]|nr:peptidoglycan-binding domain-containing protein [Terriglobia bacterium]